MLKLFKFPTKNVKEEFVINAFYPYTSRVMLPIYSVSTYDKELNEEEVQAITFCMNVKQMYLKMDKSHQWDNKVVVALENICDNKIKNMFTYFPGTIHVGYYDNKWTIGIGVYTECKEERIQQF